MDEAVNFIRLHISSLLKTHEVKAKMEEIGGKWELHAVNHIHSMPKNIEFSVILWNGTTCLFVAAKINRQTARLSNITVEER